MSLPCHVVLCGTLCLACTATHALPGQALSVDSDRDGLSDAEETALLARFAPQFFVAEHDCSALPAQFQLELAVPTVLADDGTIYGQATPRKDHAGEVELRYFHLWRRDCGEMGHALDTEHVSALVRVHGGTPEARALYWYAAAHEDTLCDASHLVRAEAIGAAQRGATVYVSAGKHASFLSEALCTHGCGGDRCRTMLPMQTHSIVNLGEAAAPMNGIAWLLASAWPLQEKMSRSDFTDARTARVERVPQTDVVWATPALRPPQAAVLGLNAGVGAGLSGGAAGARATDTAVVIGGGATGGALATSAHQAGRALGTASGSVLRALQKSADGTGKFLKRVPQGARGPERSGSADPPR